MHFETDREVMDAALAIIGTRPAQDARVMRIRNTLCLEGLEISEPCLGEPSKATLFTLLGSARNSVLTARPTCRRYSASGQTKSPCSSLPNWLTCQTSRQGAQQPYRSPGLTPELLCQPGKPPGLKLCSFATAFARSSPAA